MRLFLKKKFNVFIVMGTVLLIAMYIIAYWFNSGFFYDILISISTGLLVFILTSLGYRIYQDNLTKQTLKNIGSDFILESVIALSDIFNDKCAYINEYYIPNLDFSENGLKSFKERMENDVEKKLLRESMIAYKNKYFHLISTLKQIVPIDHKLFYIIQKIYSHKIFYTSAIYVINSSDQFHTSEYEYFLDYCHLIEELKKGLE